MRTSRVIAFALISLLMAPFGQFSAAAEPNDEISGLEFELTSSDQTLIFRNTELEEQLRVTPIGAGGNWFSDGGEKFLGGENFNLAARPIKGGFGQIFIQIEDSSAREGFAFELDKIGAEVSLLILDSGAVLVTDTQNHFISYIPKPWAKDAAGVEIDTYFEVENNVLTQVVRHTGVQLTYPLLADPWLGLDLIDFVKRSYLAPSTYKVSIGVTPWVGALYATNFPLATSIMTSAGWDEVLTKLQSTFSLQMKTFVVSRPTFKDQWDCHALGAPAGFLNSLKDPAPTWDLEGTAPPSRNVGLWIQSHCNW